MASYALVNVENKVLEVIVLSNEEIENPETGEDDPVKVEEKRKEIYGSFNARLIKTSYNNKLNGRFAQIGWTYDDDMNIFIPPKPEGCDEFIFNTITGNWEPPTQPPDLTQEEIDLGLIYIWNSGGYSDEPNGWVLDLEPDYKFPELTEEQILNGCQYIGWDRKKYFDEGIFELTLWCPIVPPQIEVIDLSTVETDQGTV